MTDKLRGRTALITGAGRGIGRAIAELFAREGARVALADIDPATAGATAEEIGAGAFGLALDVADSASVRAGVDHTIANFGQLDILVNNAGFLKYTTFEDCREEDWDRIVDINMKGPFLCTQAAIPHMRARQTGAIVNMTSLAAKTRRARRRTALRRSQGWGIDSDYRDGPLPSPRRDTRQRHRPGRYRHRHDLGARARRAQSLDTHRP